MCAYCSCTFWFINSVNLILLQPKNHFNSILIIHMNHQLTFHSRTWFEGKTQKWNCSVKTESLTIKLHKMLSFFLHCMKTCCDFIEIQVYVNSDITLCISTQTLTNSVNRYKLCWFFSGLLEALCVCFFKTNSQWCSEI